MQKDVVLLATCYITKRPLLRPNLSGKRVGGLYGRKSQVQASNLLIVLTNKKWILCNVILFLFLSFVSISW